jgi:endonuclease-3 related protein
MPKPIETELLCLYMTLLDHFGPLNWWPADSPFEVVIGAILTQNTAWANVELAIANLKEEQVLSPDKLAEIPIDRLEELIKPSGFFRQKANRLQSLSIHLVTEWQSNLNAFCSGSLVEARDRLLARPGIGPETADSILLYAVHRPSFVVDAYTRRIFERVGVLQGDETYAEVRELFTQALPEDVTLYNEYHALIVQLAKTFCKKRKPLCNGCPLNKRCRFATQATLVESNGGQPGKPPDQETGSIRKALAQRFCLSSIP